MVDFGNLSSLVLLRSTKVQLTLISGILVVLLNCSVVKAEEPVANPSAKENALNAAVKSQFPYSQNEWLVDGNIVAGSYAPCENGQVPVIIWNKATATTETLGKLTGKFLLLECERSRLPGAVTDWSSTSNTAALNHVQAGIENPAAPSIEFQTPSIKILNSVISGIKHEEVFEAEFTASKDQASGSVDLDIKSLQSYSPSGSVFVGKTEAGVALVYGSKIPKKFTIEP